MTRREDMHRLLLNGVLFFLFTFFSAEIINAQPFQYLVLFKDKVGTAYSTASPEAFLSTKAIERRQRQGIPIKERDLPVSQVYLDSLQDVGIDLLYTSKWINGALLRFDNEEEVSKLNDFSFLKKQILYV